MKNTIYYAIKEKNKLALYDGRLPIFWMKQVASRENENRLNNRGSVVKVVVQDYQNFWNPVDKEKLVSYLNTVVAALEKGKASNLNGADYAKGELSAFKRCIAWINGEAKQ